MPNMHPMMAKAMSLMMHERKGHPRRPNSTKPADAESANHVYADESHTKKRVMVVEDESAVCELLAELVDNHPGCELIGRCADGSIAADLALKLRPDILVLDVFMPGVTGIEILRELSGKIPSMKVLVFSAKQEPHIVRSLMQIGIHGYVNKNGKLSELRQALSALSLGNTWFSVHFHDTIREALNSPVSPDEIAVASLTKRELEIVALIAKSYSTKEVAGALKISIKTAENHRANLMRKLGTRDVAGLVRFAIRQRLVDSSE